MIFYLFFILILNFLFFKYNYKIAKSLNLFDNPDNFRKIHNIPVPLTGGIIILLNILALLIFLYLNKSYVDNFEIFLNKKDLFIFLASILLFFFIGLFDDKYEISANKKFLIMLLSLIPIIILSGDLIIKEIRVSFLEIEYSLPYYVSIFWTVLCFLLFINALNMFDGINYQVCFFSIYICVFFIINNYFLIFFIFVLISLINFFILNHRNKAFLGDNGSYLLAFIFSYLFVKLYNQEQTLESDHIFLIMIIPGIDLIRLFIVRISRGNNPFTPDKDHFHHILLKKYNLINVNIIIQSLIIIPSLGGFYFGYTFIFLCVQLLIYFFLIFFLK
tara:strand:- start:9341 stop:10336 length:996 start_codon:yes stop_codon:yes gene_type:complete